MPYPRAPRARRRWGAPCWRGWRRAGSRDRAPRPCWSPGRSRRRRTEWGARGNPGSRVPTGEAGEELRDALTRDDALRQFDPAAMNRQREQVVVFGELSFDREIATVDRVGEQTVPVLRGHDGVELSGRVAHGIQAAHHAAHA